MRFSPESCGAVTGRTQATARTAAAVLLPQRSNTLNSKGLAPVSRKASRTAADGRSPLVQSAITLCRSEEHTSELQSLMRISYAVFCLKKKKKTNKTHEFYKLHIPQNTKQK